MSKRLDLEDLKKEYIGKTFNWLTVLDVYSGGKGIGVMFKCRCKCGKEINVSKRTVLSNHTKSCGCLKTSEEYSDYLRQWYASHPDECSARSKRTINFYRDNPEKRMELSRKRIQYIQNNPDAMMYSVEIIKSNTKNRRTSVDYSELLPFVDVCDHKKLCNGEIRGEDAIKIHCSKCGNVEYRILKNLFIFSRASMKKSTPPLCIQCKNKYNSSKAEQEIADYIFTFYKGERIRNSREIISPLELDLYYPENGIAIEFNGDYWHSELFKDKEYHYNKFKICKERDITLVSIFESDWNNRKDDIKEYLKDLFSGTENKLSYSNDKSLMNNNYPLPKFKLNHSTFENYYMFNDIKVFTCGYSEIITAD